MDTKIIELFKNNPDKFLSGEDMSAALKCTRAAVWKHMEKLRDIGYVIEAVPHLGYKLKEVPDKMLPDEISYSLGTKFMGREIFSYAETDSTNTLAYSLAEQGRPEGLVVIAEQQTKGKGRLGRKWHSPKGGIYLSCVMRPDILPHEAQEFTLVSALAVHDSIKEITGLEAKIKWPNDLILNDKKVAGILTEMKAETDKIDFIILGIGINANLSLSSLPGGAASLSVELGERVSRINLVKALLRSLEQRYLLFKSKGFGVMRDEIKKMSYTIGKHVSVSFHDSVLEGKAIDIDEEGALLVKPDSGPVKRIVSGDVAAMIAPAARNDGKTGVICPDSSREKRT